MRKRLSDSISYLKKSGLLFIKNVYITLLFFFCYGTVSRKRENEYPEPPMPPSNKTISPYTSDSKAKDLLSDVIVFSKYAKYVRGLKRRETWEELVFRNCDMHVHKYKDLVLEDGSPFTDIIYSTYGGSVLNRKVLPSMRSLQFSGRAIELNNSRIFNCAALSVDSTTAFAETMFLLLGGVGVGVSVQQEHIDKLPPVYMPRKNMIKKFLVTDSIMGWADAVKALVKSYHYGKQYVQFDYTEIREKGTELVTAGGLAPGPQPLIDCIERIRYVYDRAIRIRGVGTKLLPIEAHDVCCHISDAVLAGGIRRAALISLFSKSDTLMMKCKSNFVLDSWEKIDDCNYNVSYTDIWGDFHKKTIYVDKDDPSIHDMIQSNCCAPWYYFEPQRGRANNSVVLLRDSTTEEEFRNIMKSVELSNAGEPGVYWTNDIDYLCNPCCEISLRNKAFCNLVEIDATDIVDQDDIEQRVIDGVTIGTLQAGYTDFTYLSEEWKINAEDEALLGVSYTGLSSMELDKFDKKRLAELALETNERIAKLIGIKPANRIGTVKPAGTTSLVLGTSSGIHSWYSDYYIRRVGINKDEALYKYLYSTFPGMLEDGIYSPDSRAYMVFPMKSPDGAITRNDETPIQLLDRCKDIRDWWISGTHREGINKHNVSVTVSIKKDEWGSVTDWMWENREYYNGISVLDFDTGTYKQTPFEDIDREVYEKMEEMFSNNMNLLNLRNIIEEKDHTDLKGEAACSGGGCEVK